MALGHNGSCLGTREPAWEPGKGSWEPGRKGGREEPGYLGREAKRKGSLYNGYPI